jgi:predicted DCC family thiol-disulfide oxidoreductase YuxK
MNDEAALLVIYDAECTFCCAAARWLERHDRRGRLRLAPISEMVSLRGAPIRRSVLEAEMHVVDAEGRIERGFRAWRRIARELPVLRPVRPMLSMPGADAMGERVYRWVAAHRIGLSRLLRCRACGEAVPRKASRRK